MQDTDLVHFTTAVNTFHKPEREKEKKAEYPKLMRQYGRHDGNTPFVPLLEH